MIISNNRAKIIDVMLLWTVLILSFDAIISSNSAYPLPISPQQQPVPKFDFDDPAKSIVVTLRFEKKSDLPTDIEKATLKSIQVSSERARTHIGDPPLLKVVLINKNNAVVHTFNTWNPLWTFLYDQNDVEHLKIQKAAIGAVVFPFERSLIFMELYSLPTGKYITRVNLTATIEGFCHDSPNDPNCKPVIVKSYCEDNPKDLKNCKPVGYNVLCKGIPVDLTCRGLANLPNNTIANLPNNTIANLPNSTRINTK
jgi:hypothetical protein